MNKLQYDSNNFVQYLTVTAGLLALLSGCGEGSSFAAPTSSTEKSPVTDRVGEPPDHAGEPGPPAHAGQTGPPDHAQNQKNKEDPEQEPGPGDIELLDPANFDYSAEHTFTLDNLLGGRDGVTAAEDPSIICQSGCEDNLLVDGSTTLYPIDNGFGWDAIDFVGAMERERDGEYADGWAGAVTDEAGNHQGIALANIPTLSFNVGKNLGQWCAGLGGNLTKCKTDHYVVMEHVLTCHETVPYMYYDPLTGMPTTPDYDNCPQLDDELDMDPLELTEYMFDLDESNMAQSSDYTIYLGEHEGEYKYLWGNYEQRPTDVRVLAHVPLPDEWKQEGRTFEVTEAKLAIVHTITNNPNDKILIEDLDTEVPAGRLPAYQVEPDGRWVSTKDCYEGDGDFIPAGTTLRNPPYADETRLTEDLQEGFTNAWYTTLDREPFVNEGEWGPRWRLKAPKFGQDLPGVEIPVEPCTQAPLQKGEVKYTRGELTSTIIDLLAPLEEGEASPFTMSTGFTEPIEEEQELADGNLTAEGVTLTEDMELSIYVKGDRNPVRLYKAVLYLDYEEVTE